MNSCTIPITDNLEAMIYIEQSLQGNRAYSLLFDDEAEIVAETDSVQYIDYCLTEICAQEITKMLPDNNLNVWDILASAGMPECACD